MLITECKFTLPKGYKYYRVLGFYISASCCSCLLSGFSLDTIRAAKSTLRYVVFTADLYV